MLYTLFKPFSFTFIYSQVIDLYLYKKRFFIARLLTLFVPLFAFFDLFLNFHSFSKYLYLFFLGPFISPQKIALLSYPKTSKELVPVFMIHKIGNGKNPWIVSPQRLRELLETLRDENYSLITIDELANGSLDPKKKYAVLTFDDSHISNFRYLEDDQIDENCAVGILEQFKATATFFICSEETSAEKIHPIFGQGGKEAKKLQFLATNGYEIGCHGSKHVHMNKLSLKKLEENLENFDLQIKPFLPQGYTINSFAYPYGSIPKDEGPIFKRYRNSVAVLPIGKAKRGEKRHIPRIYFGPYFNFRAFLYSV